MAYQQAGERRLANVIDSFELERQRPDAATLSALRRAFEDVGVVFLPDDPSYEVRSSTNVMRRFRPSMLSFS